MRARKFSERRCTEHCGPLKQNDLWNSIPQGCITMQLIDHILFHNAIIKFDMYD